MKWFDWLIIFVPLAGVLSLGMYSRKYVRSVADFLSAGRVCGRYVLSVADAINALSIIAIVAYVEEHYRTGFALTFWNSVLIPLTMVMGLTGYVTYRFRETRAMSLGQFLEMRYSRKLRFFAAALRSLSEMLANMIMPAIAARFFIYFFDLPQSYELFGIQISTFVTIMIIVMTLAVAVIWMGGSLALIITDALQGLICYPCLVALVIFVLYKFDWNNEIIPVMADRAAKESFLNPYDISKLRDFNLFALFVTFYGTVMNRGCWIGSGVSSAAKSPHEQKMSGLLGGWRWMLGTMFCVLLSIAVLTLLNHRNFAPEAKDVRVQISTKVADEVAADPVGRAKLISELQAIPVQEHEIGNPPLSEKQNLDTVYLETARKTLRSNGGDESAFQKFRTLYHQTMLAVSVRNLLPPGLTGLFCLLMILAMLSTDDSRIFSSSLTIAQDVFLPLCKKTLTPKQHLWMLRWTAAGVGLIFVLGSLFMSQLDYIKLFVTLMTSMWLGGAGPVMIFGLYSRFGTTAGAWSSLLSGAGLAMGGILVQRNWADHVYPFLASKGLASGVGSALETISRPFNPFIVWEMNPDKCPVNSYEWFFITMLLSLLIYCAVSKLTCKEPFNLDRMLHRGKYALENESKPVEKFQWRNILKKLVNITPEYTLGDKIIAWSFFVFSFGYNFLLVFVAVAVWNRFAPWKIEYWGIYFFIVNLLVPGIIAVITTIWFGIGGVRDLLDMFRALKCRQVNDLDNGQVDGHVSLADKAIFAKVDSCKNK